MKQYLEALLLLLIAMPAFALQTPQPGKNGDPRVCTQVYNEFDVVDLTVPAGAQLTVRFADDETFAYFEGSDTKHLIYGTAGDHGNVVYLKATMEMPPQPVSIRTTKVDGKPRDYLFQWTATTDIYSTPKPQPPAQVASNDPSVVAEAAKPKPEPKTDTNPGCWKVVFLYPADAKAAQAAKWTAVAARKKQDEMEITLEKSGKVNCVNVSYVGMGDAAIAPRTICNDGKGSEGSTWLEFTGSLPIVLGINPDGTDTQLAGFNYLDHGWVKVHSIPTVYRASDGSDLPVLRLRSGELVYCLFDRNKTAMTGTNTGSTNPSITRQPIGH